LREEESRSPVCAHGAVLNPLAEEDNSFYEIIDPGGERFERWISYILPHLRYLFVKERKEHVL
jgi:hypothetical protein